MRKSSLEQARRALRDDGLVVYPTDTLYGLGCQAASDAAVDELLAAKGLSENRGLSVCFPDLEAARSFAAFTPTAEVLAEAFLPGPMTLILDATDRPAKGAVAEQGTIGVRYVDREATLALAREAPIVATSANRHGEPAVETIDEARDVFGDDVDAYVDAGRLAGSGSTVVDARGEQPTVIREGPISEDEITEAMRRG